MRVLSILAAALLAISSQGVRAAEIIGAWDSNQGPMTIAKGDDGAYVVTFKLIKGKVTGKLDGDVFKGSWVREKEQLAERCKSEKVGSPFWGGFKVTFYEGIGFQGAWHFCGDEVHIMNWTGARPKK